MAIESNERLQVIDQFKSGLDKVVEMGFGEDECDSVVNVIFTDIVHKTVDRWELRKLPFTFPVTQFQEENTHAQMLKQVSQLREFVESRTNDDTPRRSPVMFPFMTTLGISGGVFMLAFHITRILPQVL